MCVTPSTTQPDHDRTGLERRLEAVERALSDDEPLEQIDRLDDLEERVVELEAAVQALRGYVGSIRAVNQDVERRADRAFRKATAVERHLAPDAASGARRRDGGGGRSDTDRIGRDGTDRVGRGDGSRADRGEARRDGRRERATDGPSEGGEGGDGPPGNSPPRRTTRDHPDSGGKASQGALSRLRRRL